MEKWKKSWFPQHCGKIIHIKITDKIRLICTIHSFHIMWKSGQKTHVESMWISRKTWGKVKNSGIFAMIYPVLVENLRNWKHFGV
ncbi:hypothetical protein DW114_04595 [Absiella sp. AM09-50]|nr:hypothetical protein DW113_04285 [Absiella sp. AM09-45]RGB78440.1 hypothetical protein DW114_04595 [Absiella sp. AM09-50]